MGWDDKFYENWDEFEYINKLGIYAENEDKDDQEDELFLFGLDAAELEYMDADERREAIEDAGLDPDDFDDIF